MTQAQYDANPSVQKWYEPFKCADCRAPAHPPASADVGLDAAGQWELVPSGFLIDGPNGTAMVLDRAFIEPKIAALCENNGDDPEDYTATELYMKAWRGRAVDMPTMAASSGRKGDAT